MLLSENWKAARYPSIYATLNLDKVVRAKPDHVETSVWCVRKLNEIPRDIPAVGFKPRTVTKVFTAAAELLKISGQEYKLIGIKG